MNITPQERLDILVDINVSMSRYTNAGFNYRPSIQDYVTYHCLLNLYENDMGDLDPQYLWRKTPDEIMLAIIESNMLFVIDYGWEDLDESIRDWVTEKGFVVNSDEVSEEEYKQLMEKE
jgi:ATP-dependent protease Clp ATPase subunit